MSRFLTTAGEQVAELIELSADEGRLSRGRALYRKGAVSDLAVVDGSVIASVRGSQGDDYETTISTTPAPPGVRREFVDGSAAGRSLDELIEDGIDICPREIDLAFACDCPDWDEPCKHAAAVVLAFADRVDLDEAELLRWRGLDPAAAHGPAASTPGAAPEPKPKPERAPAGPRTPTPPARSRPRAADDTEPGSEPEPEPDDRTAKLSELESLLGDTVMRVPTADRSNTAASTTAASNTAAAPVTMEPALADFLGVGTTIDAVDVGAITEPDPLFASLQLGPLADLGPELAGALAMIRTRLDDTTPEG